MSRAGVRNPFILNQAAYGNERSHNALAAPVRRSTPAALTDWTTWAHTVITF